MAGLIVRRAPRILQIQHGFWASLHVRTAFDVSKLAVVSKILPCIRIIELVVAALLTKMQDVRGSACYENSEMWFN